MWGMCDLVSIKSCDDINNLNRSIYVLQVLGIDVICFYNSGSKKILYLPRSLKNLFVNCHGYFLSIGWKDERLKKKAKKSYRIKKYCWEKDKYKYKLFKLILI